MFARLEVMDTVELVRSVFWDDVSGSSSSSVWLSTLIASYHLLWSSAICDLQSRNSCGRKYLRNTAKDGEGVDLPGS